MQGRVRVADQRGRPTSGRRGFRVEPWVHVGLSARTTLGLSPVSERRRWDLNPRLVAQHTISSRADSAALALLRDCSLVRLTVPPGPDCSTVDPALAREFPTTFRTRCLSPRRRSRATSMRSSRVGPGSLSDGPGSPALQKARSPARQFPMRPGPAAPSQGGAGERRDPTH